MDAEFEKDSGQKLVISRFLMVLLIDFHLNCLLKIKKKTKFPHTESQFHVNVLKHQESAGIQQNQLSLVYERIILQQSIAKTNYFVHIVRAPVSYAVVILLKHALLPLMPGLHNPRRQDVDVSSIN